MSKLRFYRWLSADSRPLLSRRRSLAGRRLTDVAERRQDSFRRVLRDHHIDRGGIILAGAMGAENGSAENISASLHAGRTATIDDEALISAFLDLEEAPINHE